MLACGSICRNRFMLCREGADCRDPLQVQDVPPPVVVPPNPELVFAVFPNPPVPPPNPPLVLVFAPKSPPPLVAVVDAPNPGLFAPNRLLCCCCWLFAPNPKPPVVVVLPPKSEPPEVVAVLLLAPKPPVFEAPKPPNPVEPVLLLLLPNPNDIVSMRRGG